MHLLIDLEPLQRSGTLTAEGQLLWRFMHEMLEVAPGAGITVHLMANTAHRSTIAPLQRRFAPVQKAGRLHLFDAPFTTTSPACYARLKAFSITGIAPDLVLFPTLDSIDETAAQALAESGVLTCPTERFATAQPLTAYPLKEAVPPQMLRSDMPSATTYGPFGKLSDAQQKDRTAAYKTFGLFRPYMVLPCTRQDPENHHATALMHAYAALPEAQRKRLDLVLTGSFDETAKTQLSHATKELGIAAEQVHLKQDLSARDIYIIMAGAVFVLDLTQDEILNGMTFAAHAAQAPVVALGSQKHTHLDVDLQNTTELTRLLDHALTHPDSLANLRIAQAKSAKTIDWPEVARQMATRLLTAAKPADIQDRHDWPALQSRLDQLEADAITDLNQHAAASVFSEDSYDHLTRALLATRCGIEDAHRGPGFGAQPPAQTWRIEGPFDSSYSLAAVNRESARGLDVEGWPIALYSSEGPGPYAPNLDYLTEHPDLAPMMARADALPAVASDITSRDMYPPRCDDVTSRFNLLHSYAWEETGFPAAFTRDINRHLQAVTVLSPHVARVLRNAGLSVPVTSVGTGVEHMDIPAEPLPFDLPEAKFRILHVSSCFPRKGADVLLAAFAQAFAGDADAAREVCLIIKTHANPHNTIEADVAALQAAHPVLPRIILETADLNPGQIRALYEAADLLVAPSRAEGFCLPIAEAVLAGTPALTTGWSGQTTFKPNPLVTFTEYDFAEAGSHLDTQESVWAEPRVDDLARHMAAARAAPAPTPDLQRRAARDMLNRHNWTNVARANTKAVHEMVNARPKVPARIGWISTFNSRCGIATYSGHLLGGLPDTPVVLANITNDVQTPDPGNVIRCWNADKADPLTRLHTTIQDQDLRTIVIQFNYGFYNFKALARLVRRLKSEGRRVVMMMHATDDAPHDADNQLASIHVELSLCDRVLVHSVHDLNRLKALGLVHSVALFPHGVLEVAQTPPPAPTPDTAFVIGTYGFMLPPKGFSELVEAIGLMRGEGRNVTLEMVNAVFPLHISSDLETEIRTQITARGLDDHVSLCTDFLEDEDSLARLAKAHLLAFPYRPTTESASGAVRQALALSRPIAVTPLPIFDDVRGLVLPLPGFDPQDIANGLGALMDEIMQSPAEGAVATALARGDNWRRNLGYSTLSTRLWAILQQL